MSVIVKSVLSVVIIGLVYYVRLSQEQCAVPPSQAISCIPGPADFSCPAGQIMTILSAGVFIAQVPEPCGTPGGLTCLVEAPITYANITAACDSQATCNFVPNPLFPIPQDCVTGSFVGNELLYVTYYCSTATPPSMDICSGATISGESVELTSTAASLSGITSTPCYCVLSVPAGTVFFVSVNSFTTTPNQVQNISSCTQAVTLTNATAPNTFCEMNQANGYFAMNATLFGLFYTSTDTSISSAFNIEITAVPGCSVSLTCIPPVTTTTTTTTIAPTTTTTTTLPPSTVACVITNSLFPFCISGGNNVATFSCLPGYAMIISSATLFKSIVGTCSTPGGESCVIDATSNFGTVKPLCDTMQSCTYTVSTAFPIPANCSSFVGPFFVQFAYTCFPAPVSPSGAITCTPSTTPTTTTTTPPTTVACVITNSLFPFCISGGNNAATFSCQPGYAMLINNATLSKSIVGTCTSPGGQSCVIDTTSNFGAVKTLCDTMQSCTYTVSTAFPIPASCSSFVGPFFIQFLYTCYPAPVSLNGDITCTPSTTPTSATTTATTTPTTTTTTPTTTTTTSTTPTTTTTTPTTTTTTPTTTSATPTTTKTTPTTTTTKTTPTTTKTTPTTTKTTPTTTKTTPTTTTKTTTQTTTAKTTTSTTTTVVTTTATTTVKPPPNQCSAINNFTVYCVVGNPPQPATVSCPVGYGLFIINSTLYKSRRPACPQFGGSSCTVDKSQNFAGLSTACNTKQSCTHSVTIPAVPPANCFMPPNNFVGPYFLETFYRCYPAPVAPNIVTLCTRTPCSSLTNFTAYCTTGSPSGPATISCPSGYGLIIDNSTLSKSQTGSCMNFTGSSCIVDKTANVAQLTQLCNTLPSCTYSVVIPPSLPPTCTQPLSRVGPYTLLTYYRCFPAPVVPNIASVCSPNPCVGLTNLTIFCPVGNSNGPATISCPTGYGMIINNSTLYRAVYQNCSRFTGSTCTVDRTINAGQLTASCNGMPSCTYSVIIPPRPPISCLVPIPHMGPYFLETYYTCYLASVVNNLATICGNTTASAG